MHLIHPSIYRRPAHPGLGKDRSENCANNNNVNIRFHFGLPASQCSFGAHVEQISTHKDSSSYDPLVHEYKLITKRNRRSWTLNQPMTRSTDRALKRIAPLHPPMQGPSATSRPFQVSPATSTELTRRSFPFNPLACQSH